MNKPDGDDDSFLLSAQQKNDFLDDGVLVVENVLTSTELQQALEGLEETLVARGVDPDDLVHTGQHLVDLSSTNGSGGVLDIFYAQWKVRLALHRKLFSITSQLWETAYCHHGETIDQLVLEERFKWHPFGSFDTSRGYAYLDRLCYRIPSELAEKIGRNMAAGKSCARRKKSPSIQRSLTPHLDCCPDKFFESARKTKWRPIQCFISLTENLEPNTGGFEAAKGFHREFEEWTKQRRPSVSQRKGPDGAVQTHTFPAPCLGEYTHIRPSEDVDILTRVQHIPVPAGAAVFWDNRLPHSNAYCHVGVSPRAVVYCSFLPDVPVNREYATRQLERWRNGQNPTDMWVERGDVENCVDETWLQSLPREARCLLAVERW